MSFLELNGMMIPTRKGGRQSDRKVGEVGIAFNGDRLEDRRAIKKEYRFTLKQSRMRLVETIRGLVLGLGESFLLNGDTYSSKGTAAFAGDNLIYRRQYGDEINQTAEGEVQDSYGNPDAKFTQCAEYIPDTTNILSEQVRTGGDIDENTNGFNQVGTPSTFQWLDDLSWEGEGCIQIETANPNEGIKTDPFACAISTFYEGTAYIWCLDSRDFRARLVGDSSGNGSWSNLSHPGGKRWARIHCTHTTDGSDTTLALEIQSVDSPVNFYVDGFQVNVSGSGYPRRGWVNGSASQSRLRYAPELVNGWTDLTIACWVLADGDPGAQRYLFRLETDLQAYLRVFKNTGGSAAQLNVYGIGREGETLDASVASFFTANEWYHLAIVLRRDPVGSENGLEVYRNGVLVSFDADEPLDLANVTKINVGNHTTDDRPLEGRMDELVFLPFAADPTMIAALADSSRTWGIPGFPKLRASGDFISAASMIVTGDTRDHNFVGVTIDGEHRNNARELEFELFQE